MGNKNRSYLRLNPTFSTLFLILFLIINIYPTDSTDKKNDLNNLSMDNCDIQSSEPEAYYSSIDVPLTFSAGAYSAPDKWIGPILINNDSDFQSAAVNFGFTGAGSIQDPFIIQSIGINASLSDYALKIINTSYSFIIRNVTTIHGKYAIEIRNSSNYIIEHNTIQYAQTGIYSFGYETQRSENVTIRYNSIVECSGTGIVGFSIKNIIVEWNNVQRCGYEGIDVVNSYDLWVQHNYLLNNSQIGIKVGNNVGSARIVFNNTVINSQYKGIGSEGTFYLNVSHNLVLGGFNAMKLEASYCNISRNTISDAFVAYYSEGINNYFYQNNFLQNNFGVWEYDHPGIYLHNFWLSAVGEDNDNDGYLDYEYKASISNDNYEVRGDTAPSVKMFPNRIFFPSKSVFLGDLLNSKFDRQSIVSNEDFYMNFTRFQTTWDNLNSGITDEERNSIMLDHYELFAYRLGDKFNITNSYDYEDEIAEIIQNDKNNGDLIIENNSNYRIGWVAINTNITSLSDEQETEFYEIKSTYIKYLINTSLFDEGDYIFKIVSVTKGQNKYVSYSAVHTIHNKLSGLKIVGMNMLLGGLFISGSNIYIQPPNYKYDRGITYFFYYSSNDGKSWTLIHNYTFGTIDKTLAYEFHIDKDFILLANPSTEARIKVVAQCEHGLRQEAISERFIMVAVPFWLILALFPFTTVISFYAAAHLANAMFEFKKKYRIGRNPNTTNVDNVNSAENIKADDFVFFVRDKKLMAKDLLKIFGRFLEGLPFYFHSLLLIVLLLALMIKEADFIGIMVFTSALSVLWYFGFGKFLRKFEMTKDKYIEKDAKKKSEKERIKEERAKSGKENPDKAETKKRDKKARDVKVRNVKERDKKKQYKRKRKKGKNNDFPDDLGLDLKPIDEKELDGL